MEVAMPSNKEAVIQTIESSGEIGVAGLAKRLHLDKGTVRKVALEAAREGRIGARNNGQGYVFFPATNQAGQRFLSDAEPSNSDQLEPVIDADFWELPTPHSDSRALVVHGAAQPADNRMAGTLAAADKARRRQDGVPLPAGYAASLNGLFAGDQDEAWASLQQRRIECAPHPSMSAGNAGGGDRRVCLDRLEGWRVNAYNQLRTRRTLLTHSEIDATRKANAAMSLATPGPRLTTPVGLCSKAYLANEVLAT